MEAPLFSSALLCGLDTKTLAWNLPDQLADVEQYPDRLIRALRTSCLAGYVLSRISQPPAGPSSLTLYRADCELFGLGLEQSRAAGGWVNLWRNLPEACYRTLSEVWDTAAPEELGVYLYALCGPKDMQIAARLIRHTLLRENECGLPAPWEPFTQNLPTFKEFSDVRSCLLEGYDILL